jgi:hypothetical protein
MRRQSTRRKKTYAKSNGSEQVAATQSPFKSHEFVEVPLLHELGEVLVGK